MSKTKITMIKDIINGKPCLLPYGAAAIKDFENVSGQKPVIVKAHQPRNPKHHDRIWSIYQIAAETDPVLETADQINEWVKIKLGYVDYIIKHEGRSLVKTRSISFESMDQIKFKIFYDRAIKVLCERLGVDVEDLLNHREQAA